MYKLISLLGILVRQIILPNPFECFGASAALINMIAGIVMAPISYLIVGFVYDKRSEPAVGSILYLVTYTLLTGLLWIMGIFAFAWWWVLALVVLCTAIIIGIRKASLSFD